MKIKILLIGWILSASCIYTMELDNRKRRIEESDVVPALKKHNCPGLKELCTALEEENVQRITELIVRDRVDCNSFDQSSSFLTPLQWALYETIISCLRAGVGFEGTVQGRLALLLLRLGANINAQNGIGCTALHMAVDIRDGRSFQFLLNQGANVNIRDCKGLSALSYAIRDKNKGMLTELLRRGATIAVANHFFKGDYSLALDTQDAEIIRFIKNTLLQNPTFVALGSQKCGLCHQDFSVDALENMFMCNNVSTVIVHTHCAVAFMSYHGHCFGCPSNVVITPTESKVE